MGVAKKPNLEDSQLVAAARAGDQRAFASLTEGYRSELQVHCYRMLGSLEDAQDLVQEALLRAWTRRESFEGRSTFRAWLYRIATNGCIDFLERSKRRHPHRDTVTSLPLDLPWLQPYPDHLLEELASSDEGPDARIVTKETIELAYLVALQLLSPSQRAALILCDVLDWSAREVAVLLETTVPSVNGALRRARETLKKYGPSRGPEWKPGADPAQQERVLLQRYVEAGERGDVAGLAALCREDVRFAMPPEAGVWAGRDVVVQGWRDGGFGSPSFGTSRCMVTRANRMPAVASYVRAPGEAQFRFLALDVLAIEGGLIVEVIAFSVPGLCKAFNLPETL
ncbi:MAG: RNA polymerase subunit sigma-70 [Gemmatimonadota bacterium]